MRFIGMLRVKDEGRWITEVVNSIVPLCDQIFLMDDHSTDATSELAASAGAIVLPSPFTGIDESRDKSWLLEQISERVPNDGQTAVLCIDGDEILEPEGPRKIRELLASAPPERGAWSLRILYLWDSMDQVRTDGVYGRFYRPSLFRFNGAETFKRTDAGGNFHCSSVPARWIRNNHQCDAALLHLGYLHREDRIRKYEWYRSVDPHNSAEDGYRHVVQGDIPEVPATAKLRHAGPLKLEKLT